jgi:hypothetical protein
MDTCISLLRVIRFCCSSSLTKNEVILLFFFKDRQQSKGTRVQGRERNLLLCCCEEHLRHRSEVKWLLALAAGADGTLGGAAGGEGRFPPPAAGTSYLTLP